MAGLAHVSRRRRLSSSLINLIIGPSYESPLIKSRGTTIFSHPDPARCADPEFLPRTGISPCRVVCPRVSPSLIAAEADLQSHARRNRLA